MLDTLNNLTPAIAIGGLLFFMTSETWFPYFKHSSDRKRQRWRNLGMVAVAFVANVTLGIAVAWPAAWSEANHFGLLHRLLGQSTPAIVLGIFLFDLALYAAHVSMHQVPMFWRFHRVHHADTEMDSTSGLRQQPFEALYVAVILAIVAPVLGISRASTIIYTTIVLPWFLLNHSNIKYPLWFERTASWLMSTPDWHRVHHSAYQPETDSHDGCVFSIWDRLFGTSRQTQVEAITFGLERYREPGDQTVWKLLRGSNKTSTDSTSADCPRMSSQFLAIGTRQDMTPEIDSGDSWPCSRSSARRTATQVRGLLPIAICGHGFTSADQFRITLIVESGSSDAATITNRRPSGVTS